MSKSQKPQVTTQQTNSQTVMPEYVQDAQKNLLATGQSVLDPYFHTPGYGVSGFSQDQTTAMGGVRDLYSSAMNGSGALDPSEIQKYLNPYTHNVVDTTNQTLRDQNDVTLNGIRARAAAGSSFGGSGSRAALMETTANKDLSNTIASTTAQLMSQGYDKATATALASKQSDLATRAASTQALMESGNQQQQLYQTQQDVPLKALQNLLAITPQQYGSSTSGTTVTTAPPPQGPSTLQSVLGGGLSILGMKTAGGGSIGGSLMSAALPSLMSLSDRNDKTDIKKLGEDPETGLPMYAYRYKDDPKNTPKTVGPMAQDIEKRFPGTTKDIGGHRVVNMGALRSVLGV